MNIQIDNKWLGGEDMEIEHIYSDLPILETERLLLRKITLEDVHDMHTYASNDEVAKYVTWNAHKTIADTREFIEFVLQKYENNQVAPWGIELKENGRFIGTVDFTWWDHKNQSAELGYVIAKEYWGQGIMSEITQELIQFGFTHMDLVRIQARCLVDNIGSRRVMEKSGMSFEGILRKVIKLKGTHHDVRLYSILKEEFRSKF